ncbi:MAG: universal stress protein [Caldilineaceae bacterium]|nr:universal stress protein [Caldilineaceae bacterium]
MTKNHVLIPVEQAGFSLQIIPHIRRFLNPAENQLVLFHVEPTPETIQIQGPVAEDLTIYVDESEAALRTQFADQSLMTVRALEAVGFDVTTEVAFGQPIPAIEKALKERPIDLIAMTTHGRTGLDRLLHGSVAEHILHHATVPLLLLHPEN